MTSRPRTRYAHCDQPLPCLPGASPFHIKGEFYRLTASAAAHHDVKSGGAVSAILERRGLREFAGQTFLASALYDVLPVPRIAMAIAEARERDVEELTTRMGEAAAQALMTGVYGRLLSGVTPQNFHHSFPRVIAQFYDFGPVTVEPRPSGAWLSRTGVPLCVAEWWSLVTIPFMGVPLAARGVRDFGASWSVEARGVDRGVPVGNVTWDVHWTVPA